MFNLIFCKIESKLTSEKGYIGAAAVATIAILAVLGAGLSSLVISEMIGVIRYQNDTRAYYLAKAGVHHALYDLNDDDPATTATIDPPVTLGDGTYYTEYDSNSGVIRSYGTVGNNPQITKTISVRLKPREYQFVEEFDDRNAPTAMSDGNNVEWGYDPVGNTGLPSLLTSRFTPGPPSTQMTPDAAIDAEGNIYVVWQDNRRGGSFTPEIEPIGDWDIYIRKTNPNFDSDALVELWSHAGLRVNRDNTNQPQARARIALDKDGNIFVVWQDRRNGNWDIYVAKIDPKWGGRSWDFKVNDDSDRDQEFPAIAFSQKTGEADSYLYVVWRDSRNNPIGRKDIYAQKLNPAATDRASARVWGADKNVDGNNDYVDVAIPAVGADKSGNVYFAWEARPQGPLWNNYYNIYARKMNWNENWVWGDDPNNNPKRVSSRSGQIDGYRRVDNKRPRLVADNSGNCYFTWERWFTEWPWYGGNDYDNVYAQKLNSNGDRQWQLGWDVDVAHCGEPDIELIGSYLYIPYVTARVTNANDDWWYDDGSICAQKLNPSTGALIWGSFWPKGRVIPSRPGGPNGFPQRVPVVVGNSSSEMYYVWKDERNGTDNKDIYARKFNDSTPLWTQDRKIGNDPGTYADGWTISGNVTNTNRPILEATLEIYQVGRGAQYTFRASANGDDEGSWGDEEIRHSHETEGAETLTIGTVDAPYSFPVLGGDLRWRVNPIDINDGNECTDCGDLLFNRERTPAIDKIVITYWAGAVLDYSTWRSD